MPAVKGMQKQGRGSTGRTKGTAAKSSAKTTAGEKPAATSQAGKATRATRPPSAVQAAAAQLEWRKAFAEVTGVTDLSVHDLHERVRDYVVRNNLKPKTAGKAVKLDKHLKTLVGTFRGTSAAVKAWGPTKTGGDDPGPMIIMGPGEDPGPMIIGAAVETSLKILGGEGLEPKGGSGPAGLRITSGSKVR